MPKKEKNFPSPMSPFPVELCGPNSPEQGVLYRVVSKAAHSPKHLSSYPYPLLTPVLSSPFDSDAEAELSSGKRKQKSKLLRESRRTSVR